MSESKCHEIFWGEKIYIKAYFKTAELVYSYIWAIADGPTRMTMRIRAIVDVDDRGRSPSGSRIHGRP